MLYVALSKRAEVADKNPNPDPCLNPQNKGKWVERGEKGTNVMYSSGTT